MKKQIITTIICLIMSVPMYSQQLLGHINSQEIISIMPEAAKAQLELQKTLEDLQEQGQMLAVEYENQLKEFQLNQEGMSEAIRTVQLQQLQQMETNITAFQQTAQQSLQQEEAKLFEPILTKIQNAIDVVAEKNGYSYVFDIGGAAAGLVYKNDTHDLTSYVKSELKL